MTPAKLLTILKAVAAYRTLLFPAIVGFISAFAAAIGWKVDIGKVQAVVNATGALATVLSLVVGAIMDANNAKVREVISAHADELDVLNPETPSARIPPTLPPAQKESPPKDGL